MKGSLWIIAIIAMLCAMGEHAPGQIGGGRENLTINLSSDRDKMTIGDLITLTLEVKSPASTMVKEPDLSAFLQDFELRNAKKPLVQEKEGEKTSIFQYEITTFTTGKKKLGPLAVRYKLTPDESDWRKADTRAITINVESVLPKELKNVDIKDIKPPMEVNYPWYYYAIAIALLLLLALLTWLIVRHMRNKRARRLAEAEAARKSPEEIANERLRALKESSLLETGRIKEYYSELSEIVREYLEGRYEPHALDMTTMELYRALKDGNITPAAAGDIKALLSQCDMVKFAQHIPAESRIDTDYQETGRIIETIKPRESLTTDDRVSS